ncbi:DUF7342 family protein [Natrinema ejinorense]|uniref:Uncharacterized protein n=1 Tax=Natrinema ejinorense TaxID=373386 RepID=A0A2A5QUY1_9EURY|nr:helix-turn-helix domain-containing protein [Natrinema ejinorense]PCR90624.1 hypothetical protein CP557_08955 [Natrinema ejinorense]
MSDRFESAETPPEDRSGDRTTFQRVYDCLVGTTEPASAEEFASRADCSENGARRALEQLVEMGIADRSNERPALYRRNQSYFRWKRVETHVRDHSASELRTRLEELIDADRERQERYGVPEPDAVVPDDSIEDHETLHDRWEDLTEWRTIRRDITLLKRAVQRAESSADERAQV